MKFSNSQKVTASYTKVSSEQLQQSLNHEIQGFNYNALTPQVRVLVQGKTFELKSLMRRSAQDIIDIGQRLIEVKEQLGHGNFRAWLKAEFDWSVRTANRFMQVATQFKCAKLAHLDITVSALYLLAETSTPEKARKQALELATQGENINHRKAKVIVNHYRKLAQSNTSKRANKNISTQCEESNLFTPTMQHQSQNTPFHFEAKHESKLVLTETVIEVVDAIGSDEASEHEEIEKIDSILREDSKMVTELRPEDSNDVSVLSIQHKKSELPSNIAQIFEMTFANTYVYFQGSPATLILLFEQMQNNPDFTKKIIKEAKLLAVNNKDADFLGRQNNQ